MYGSNLILFWFSGDVTFDTLSTYNVNVSVLSGVDIQDLVDISEPSLVIPGKIVSAGPVSASFLEVSERLCDIRVKNGQLEVLTTNGSTKNVVTGLKTIDRLTITDSVNIQGTILGLDTSAQPKRPPVIQFDQPFDIAGEFLGAFFPHYYYFQLILDSFLLQKRKRYKTYLLPLRNNSSCPSIHCFFFFFFFIFKSVVFAGDVVVHSSVNIVELKATDFVDPSRSLSLIQTLKNGLRLDSPDVLANIVFEGNLKVLCAVTSRFRDNYS